MRLVAHVSLKGAIVFDLIRQLTEAVKAVLQVIPDLYVGSRRASYDFSRWRQLSAAKKNLQLLGLILEELEWAAMGKGSAADFLRRQRPEMSAEEWAGSVKAFLDRVIVHLVEIDRLVEKLNSENLVELVGGKVALSAALSLLVQLTEVDIAQLYGESADVENLIGDLEQLSARSGNFKSVLEVEIEEYRNAMQEYWAERAAESGPGSHSAS